jgi:hypothetical protein
MELSATVLGQFEEQATWRFKHKRERNRWKESEVQSKRLIGTR